MRWSGHVACMGDTKNPYSIMDGKPEGERPLGGPQCRWKDNIRMDLREMWWDGVDWIQLVEDRD